MAKMRAKVELLGCETHQARGRSFQRGKPQILTNPSDIAYYKAQSEFSVTLLSDGTPKPAAKPAKAAKRPAPPPEDDDDSEDDDTEDGDEDSEDDDDTEDGDEDSEDSEDDSESSEASPVYKKADLEKLNKKALVELAKDDFGMDLNEADNKSKLVAAILKEQIARAS